MYCTLEGFPLSRPIVKFCAEDAEKNVVIEKYRKILEDVTFLDQPVAKLVQHGDRAKARSGPSPLYGIGYFTATPFFCGARFFKITYCYVFLVWLCVSPSA